MQITIQNYFQKTAGIDFSRENEALRKGHEFTLKASTNGTDWTPYASSESIRRVVDLYFTKLGEFLDKKAPITPATRTRTAATRKETVPKPSKEKQYEDETQVTRLEHIHEEVKFIKRYVGLHNKMKSPNAILNFIKALQKAIVQKYITKKSQFASEISLIQDKLITLYNKMKKDERVEINDEDLARMVSIAGGETVYTSIGFIKRYIGMQGKVLEKKKIDACVKQISNALDKNKLANDPYADKVTKILQALQKQPKTKPVSIAQTELKGLAGIVKKCGCDSLGRLYRTGGKKLKQCKTSNYSDARKGACSHHRGLSGVMTAQEIASRRYDMLPINGEWRSLIGQPEKNFVMMLHGEPGSGKTTFLMKFAKYLSGLGSILYVSSEEFDSSTLREKVLKYLNPLPANIHFAQDIRNVNLSNYDMVVLDSVTDLGLSLEDFKALKNKYPHTAFILILQHTKDGQFRGGKEWEHEAQIVGRVSNGVIEIYKNRYGVKGSMNFFNQPYSMAA